MDEIHQGMLFIHPEVEIEGITTSHKGWGTYRAGFDEPERKDKPHASPTDDEKGILYFGGFESPITRELELNSVTLSFFSKNPPGHITVLSNRFGELLPGPVLIE